MQSPSLSLSPYPIYREDLPETAVELIDLIGWPSTAALIRELGGVPYPMPNGKDNNEAGAKRYSKLVELVGDKAAELLLFHYRDCSISIPTCATAIARGRNRHLQQCADKGETLEELSIRFRVTTRWVSYILKKWYPPVGAPLE